MPVMTMVLSCNQSIHKNNLADIVKEDTITQSEIISSKDENKNLNNDTILHAGVDTFSIRLQMNGIKDRKIIPLTIVSGKDLFAVIYKETNKANIRINQIEMPDSWFDGPFGDSLHYKIKMHGVYKIIIGADLMAAGKSNEAFILKAWAK
ncbi:MAG: hypothetical protein ABI261_05355 [Ginsengibacter sp.]